MSKGPPPEWRRRDCSFDHLVGAAVSAGWGQILKYEGIETIERAQEIRRGLYRCAKHREISMEGGTVALAADDETMGIRRERDGTYTIKFRVWTKAQARKAHLARYGSSRESWPYDPRRPATQEERASWANKNELGEPVFHDLYKTIGSYLMSYCPDCGAELHNCQADQPDPAAEEARAETKIAKEYTSAEVEIARLNTERDVAVARIQAGLAKDEAIQEAEIVTAEAEGIVEALAPEPEEESPDVVIVADADAEAEEPEETLPPAEEQGGEPVTTGSKSSNPWW
jgi:hypothetical protein